MVNACIGEIVIKKLHYILLLLFCVLVVPGNTGDGEKYHLPHRHALDSDVRFWKKIFADLSLDQYLIHDSQDLSILYKTVTFDSSVSARQRERELEKVKNEIKAMLLKFHSGEFNEFALDSWERLIYRQFDKVKGGNKFLEASQRVRAQQGIRENFLAGVKRSFAYLPYIEDVLRQEGIPTELKYLPHIESSFNPVAQSHVGAAGMWQFMRSTGRLYMKVNNVKDERFDPLTSTKSAARLLKYNYNDLKDWALAITAYNHGLGSMRKAKRQYGSYMKIRESYLRRSFGFASKNFYPEFLAVVEIADSIEHYFPGLQGDPLIVFQEIVLPAAVSLPGFTKKYRIDVEELKELNPGFRRHIWTGSGNVPAGYTLRLPLRADAAQILASLGASPKERESIRLVQKTPDQDRLLIASLKDIHLQKQAMQQYLTANRIGVESVYQHNYGFSADDNRFALTPEAVPPVVPEQPLLMQVPESATASVYAPFGKPGIESAYDKQLAGIAVLPLVTEESVASAGVPAPPLESIEAGEVPVYPSRISYPRPGVIPPDEIPPLIFFVLENFSSEPDLSSEGLALSSVEVLPEPATPAATASPHFTNEELELLSAVNAAIRIASINNTIRFGKREVEAEIFSAIRPRQSFALTGESTLEPDLPRERVALSEDSPLLPKSSLVMEWAKPGVLPEAAPLAFAFPGEDASVMAAEEKPSEEIRTLASANTLPDFNLVDSLLIAESLKQPAETWLAFLKPGVEQVLPHPGKSLPVFSSPSSSPESPEGIAQASAAIYFKKQGVERNQVDTTPESQWAVASNAQEEFTLQEVVVFLRRRLNSDKDMIHIYPQETLGHISEWLKINVHHLRQTNSLSRNQKIYTGQRLKLDFSRVTPAEFLEMRLSYHLDLVVKQLQGNNKIKLVDYTVNSGENLWNLAHKRYNFPVNLLLYFNDFDKLERLYPGDIIKLPVIYN